MIARKRTLEGHTDWVPAVAVTPDGRRVVSGSWDKTLYRLIGIAEVVLLDQILVDPSGTQANLELSANHLS